MLDDVQRRRFLVEPAGEDPAPLLVGPLHVDLDEGAGQLFGLPRRGRLACAQPHDHVFPPHGLARAQRHVLNDAIALVEDAEHRDALGHRGHPALPGSRCRRIGRGRRRRILLLGAPAAGREREHNQQRRGNPGHFYSGIHGS
jgi:hypothetical protein